jgi:hypothetical protein
MTHSRKLRIVFLGLTLVAAPSFCNAAISIDATQAQEMLRLLDRCKDNAVSAQAVDEVLALPGTGLIIAQQNVSRRVTHAQYKSVVIAACRGDVAHIEPAESGARAEKGVQGLVRDVVPSLIWGRNHIPELKARLEEATKNSQLEGVVPLALKNLPEKVVLSPKLYFVMGGRAGAAASDEGIYIDLLALTWRQNSASMTQQEMVEFFAHETHHIGYGRILDRKRQSLSLTPSESRMWNFLSAILMEGSATLLINAHGSWAELETQTHIKNDLDRLPQLLAETQTILEGSISRTIGDREYENDVSDFSGEGYHAVGAKLLYVIEEQEGKQGVLNIMDNPTRLLVVYNECAEKSSVAFRFKPQVAQAVENIGRPH